MMFSKMNIPSQNFGCAAKSFLFVACSMLILTHSACSSIPIGTRLPSTSPILSGKDTPSISSESTSIVLPADTASPENETPSENQNLPTVVDPLITAEVLRFDSWSLNSVWVAYWLGEDNEELPASLAFANVQSGEVCSHEELIAPNLGSGQVLWQGDGQAVVILSPGEGAFAGLPCGAFDPIENDPLSEIWGELSPDGHYLARLIHASKGQLITYTVTITDTATNQTVATYSWDASIYLTGSGPGWLNNELYLLGQTYQQGVLYLSVLDGQTRNVLTELMGIEIYDEETVWWVMSQSDPATGAYHLLLEWRGGPTDWPPLLLYHSELDLVEELPFYKVRPFDNDNNVTLYGFSPSGQWLLVGNPVEGGNPAADSGQDYWLRMVDPPGGSFVQMENQAGLGGMSSNGEMIAFLHDNSYVDILSFPEGELLSEWHMPDYDVDRLWWSPNSSRLIVWGINPESGQHALFAIEIEY